MTSVTGLDCVVMCNFLTTHVENKMATILK